MINGVGILSILLDVPIFVTIYFRNLIDLGYKGCKYTWPNHQKRIKNLILERLDSVFVSNDWLDIGLSTSNPSSKKTILTISRCLFPYLIDTLAML